MARRHLQNRYVQNRRNLNRRSLPAADASSRLRRWGLVASLVGLCVIAGVTVLKQKLPGQICGECRSRLQAVLNDTGLVSSIRDTTFIEGRGIQISDLIIHGSATNSTTQSNAHISTAANSSDTDPLLEIYSVFVHMQATTAQLVAGTAKPSRVEIRGGKLTLARNADGTWNTGSLDRLGSLSCDGPPVPVSITDCTLRIVDHFQNPPLEINLRDISIEAKPVQHDGRQLMQISGTFAGNSVAEVGFSGYYESETGRWYAEQIRASEFALSADMLTLIPPSIRGDAESLVALTGNLSVDGRAEGSIAEPGRTRFELNGQLRDFSVNDRRLPAAISRTNVDFVVSDRHLQVKRATGVADQGSFDVSYWQDGLLSRGDWQFAGTVNRLDFTERLHPWLSNGCRKFCADFSPTGTSDIRFRLASTGGTVQRDVHAIITDMSFEFVKFPFRTEHCRGTAIWVGNELEFDLIADEKRTPLRLNGRVHNPGPNATFEMALAAEGPVAIDEKLYGALGRWPNLQKALRDFQPKGDVSGVGRLIKADPNLEHVSREFDIQLLDCGVRHRKFLYDIQNVRGTVKYRGNKTMFEEIEGSSGDAAVRCNGSWDERTGLSLRFLAEQVPIDDKLRTAVNSQTREIWDSFRPRGNIGLMRVDLSLPRGQRQADVTVSADLTETAGNAGSVSIFPTWFPYEIVGLTGRIQIGNGIVSMENLRGGHGRTWITCQGDGRYSPEEWSVSLKNLIIGSLKVDRDLLTALPGSLAPAIRQLQFDGLVNVGGEVSLGGRVKRTALAGNGQQGGQGEPGGQGIVQAGYNESVAANNHGRLPAQTRPEEPTRIPRTQSPPQTSVNSGLAAGASIGWNLRFNMNQADLMIGMPVRNVFGMVQLVGNYDGQTAVCRGELAIDSLMLHNAQIKNISGPIWMDESGVAVGSLAQPPGSQAAVRQVTGKMFEGQLVIDGKRSSANPGQFILAVGLSDGDLKEAVNDYAPQMNQINGKCYASLRLTGDDSGTRSYRGGGTVSLRNAEIYELPVMVSLLKILNVKEVNRTAFDSGNLEFAITGDTLDFQRIELIGDAVSLIGNGQMSMDRRIDLNFYSVIGRGRWYIPIVSELYKAGSQRALWINVNGSFDDPQTHKHILPQLNDSIRALLQGRPQATNNYPVMEFSPARINPAAEESLPVGSFYLDR